MVVAARPGSFAGRTPEVAEPEAWVAEPAGAAAVEDELFWAAGDLARPV